MANIGTFKKSGDKFQGEIVTMSLQKKNVSIVPEPATENENAPSHRVFVGAAEIGAAWPRTSKENRAYLSIKLDDPSFNAPIFASSPATSARPSPTPTETRCSRCCRSWCASTWSATISDGCTGPRRPGPTIS